MKLNNILLKPSLLMASIMLVLCSFSSAFAGDKANFSGTWSLDESKSEMGEFRFADVTKVITQEENKLVMERTYNGMDGQDMKISETYTLDGKECKNQGMMNSERVSTVKWSDDSKKLIIKSTISFDMGGQAGSMEITEEISLSDDGKTLTVTSSSEMGGTQKIVYVKK